MESLEEDAQVAGCQRHLYIRPKGRIIHWINQHDPWIGHVGCTTLDPGVRGEQGLQIGYHHDVLDLLSQRRYFYHCGEAI